MTTTTVPDVDLEQWLKGDLERACQVEDEQGNTCLLSANWMVSVEPGPGCTHAPHLTHLICDLHHEQLIVGGADCLECGAYVTVTWTERIR